MAVIESCKGCYKNILKFKNKKYGSEEALGDSVMDLNACTFNE